jgi:hypothetical protein
MLLFMSSTELCRYSDGLLARESGFDSRGDQFFPLLYRVQTGCGAHPAPYRMRTDGKAAGV